ncbi:queuosine precursor transporter [Halorubellus sp. JP-L1]|uniref:queuosine precursor transporter n=1 Tax=Halorubellus sp. JP-L1 TaxID=2715753 RepID=UPI00140B2BA2|nr:queuosine precursor transporter [Halorubellus sp. JP-L1]NHN40259.1 queuosine precursor transporter [Halorubellus sp. JP-L1]
MNTAPVREGHGAGVGQVALIGLFVTALATAQLTASKLLMFGLPVELPVAGGALVLPGAALAYALTFFASDCYSELYGRRAATVVVNVGFALNFVVLLLVWSTIAAPALPDQPVDPGTYATVLGASTNVVLGSLLAYVVSQNWDVYVFHRLRDYTDGDDLWLRNIGSTATSQAIDTVIFVTVAFAIAPAVLGIGAGRSPSVILALVVGQYLFKLLVAVVDTPFVYLVVGLVEEYGDGSEPVDPATR